MPTPPDDDSDEYAGWTDTQLVRHVTHSHGATDLGGHAELLRRLTDQLRASGAVTEKQNKQLTTLNRLLVALTGLLLVLSVVQVWALRC